MTQSSADMPGFGARLSATAQARKRPTFAEAHLAAHLTLDDYAEIVDGRLVVGPYCAGFAGDAVIGEDPLPPFRPNCSCVAS